MHNERHNKHEIPCKPRYWRRRCILNLFQFVFHMAERQRSPSAHLVRRNGGTHCWLHYSWLLLAPAQNRFRVVRALRVFSGGRSVVRALTIIFLANVRGQGTAHLVRCTLDPIVGAVIHKLALTPRCHRPRPAGR